LISSTLGALYPTMPGLSFVDQQAETITKKRKEDPPASESSTALPATLDDGDTTMLCYEEWQCLKCQLNNDPGQHSDKEQQSKCS
jgi:hypothetical protein